MATFDEMRAAGKTMIFVSHDLGSIRRLCDRAVLLQGGTIGAIGAPDDVVDTYLERLPASLA